MTEPPTPNDLAEIPQFTRLDPVLIWKIGSHLVEHCLEQRHAVTISARLGKQRVFHAALPGTSADNDAWVDRKLRIVEHFGIPSLTVQDRYLDPARDFHREFGLDPALYAPAGGAVPLLVAGALVGGLAVSGLASQDDHMLALAALRRFSDSPT
jgi:uncharacterized protein (UPF0303 family)